MDVLSLLRTDSNDMWRKLVGLAFSEDIGIGIMDDNFQEWKTLVWMLMLKQGWRKRSGWYGFGRTNILARKWADLPR